MKKEKNKPFNIISLLIIFIVGTYFRFQGILTAYGGADEVEMVKTGMLFTWRNLFKLHIYGAHPPLYYYLLFIANHTYFLFMKILGVYKRPNEIYVEYIINPFKFLVIDRCINFILGSLLVILIYFLTIQIYNRLAENSPDLVGRDEGKRLHTSPASSGENLREPSFPQDSLNLPKKTPAFQAGEVYKNKRIALLASILVAFNPWLINYSRRNLLEIPATFFSMLVFYFSYKIINKGRSIDYYLAGLSLGLVLTTKITGALSAPAIIIAHLIRNWEKSVKQKFLDKRLYYCYLIPIIFFFLIQPYLISKAFEVYISNGFNIPKILETLFSLEVIKWQNEVVKYGWVGLTIQKIPFIWIFPPVLREEARLAYLYLICLIYSLIRHQKKDLILLVSIITSIFWFGRITTMGQDIHYLIPIFPLLAILTAKLIDDFTARIKLVKPGILNIILAVFLLYPNILSILGTIKEVKRIDTRFVASRWISEKIPSGKKFCLAPYSPFLFDPDDNTNAVRGKDELVKKTLKERTENVKWYKITNFDRKALQSYWPKNFTKEQIEEYNKSRYLAIMFQYDYPGPQILREEKVDYLIFSSYDYYSFTGENVYPKTNPLFYYMDRTQKIYRAVINDQGKNYQLIKEFKPDGNLTGPVILIFKLKYEAS